MYIDMSENYDSTSKIIQNWLILVGNQWILGPSELENIHPYCNCFFLSSLANSQEIRIFGRSGPLPTDFHAERCYCWILMRFLLSSGIPFGSPSTWAVPSCLCEHSFDWHELKMFGPEKLPERFFGPRHFLCGCFFIAGPFWKGIFAFLLGFFVCLLCK